ncbi:MAG: ATP-dependent Clp protease ATP-binding subunit ClpA [Desulfovibrio sp.]
MLGKHLEAALAAAVADVQARRHEYLTLEHLLYAITEEGYGEEILESCGVDIQVVKRRLEDFFKAYMNTLPDGTNAEVVQTLAVQRVLQRAMRQIQDAGRDFIEIGDVLAAMLEEDSYAGYFLLSQGITRVSLLEVISHVKPAREESREADRQENGEEEGSHEKVLQKYTVDLTARARAGLIDPLVGRNEEVTRTIQVLSRRRKNNPLLVGDPGVGKTAIAEGLALRIVNGEVPPMFDTARVFALDMGALLAGSKYRGDFEGRLKAVVAAVQSIPKAVMVIDEIHTIVGAGATTGGAMDASNILKPVLASGRMRCIGSTTHEEYRNHFEKDRALSRRFQKIDIAEPSQEECVAILKGLKSRYEEHHNVRYTAPALRAAVSLSVRHLQDKLLPDKAIDVIDEAGAAMRLARNGRGSSDTVIATVGVPEIEKIIASMARIPSVKVSTSDRDRLKNLSDDLGKSVFGQGDAVSILTRAVLRARAGFGGQSRPQGSFLFYGPTGVGKTELAKQLAASLGVSFLRYDMSEYMEKHAVSRLIGAPPGYVGFDQGGLLTEAVRKTPHCVLLLDEIEKAHPDIFNILLQVMDYATLTDNTGRKTDFRNVVLIMTSNAGAFEMSARSLGFAAAHARGKTGDTAAKGRKAVEKLFSPEFRNRLDAMVPFANLSQDVMGKIVDKFAAQLTASLKEKRVALSFTDSGRAWLAKKGYDPAFGARPLARIMREFVEDELASEVLFGKLSGGGKVIVDAESLTAEKLTFAYSLDVLEGGTTYRLEAGESVKLLPAETDDSGPGRKPRGGNKSTKITDPVVG